MHITSIITVLKVALLIHYDKNWCFNIKKSEYNKTRVLAVLVQLIKKIKKNPLVLSIQIILFGVRLLDHAQKKKSSKKKNCYSHQIRRKKLYKIKNNHEENGQNNGKNKVCINQCVSKLNKCTFIQGFSPEHAAMVTRKFT